MDLGLTGKAALVTGGSRGIGYAVTAALAREGARVVTGARRITDDLERLAESTGKVRPVAVDLAEPEGPRRLVDEALDAFGALDVVVNNVGGVRPRYDGFLAMDDEDWLWGFTRNLLVPVRTIRAALPHLIDSGGGTIVNVGSINAFFADPDVYDYGAAKAALWNFSKALSKEVAKHNVRVNTISPGPVRTDLWTRAGGIAPAAAASRGVSEEEFLDGVAALAPTGRFTEPEEVADLVVLLCGDRARNVVGSDVTIDGGLIPTL